jgi:hypothetical protein
LDSGHLAAIRLAERVLGLEEGTSRGSASPSQKSSGRNASEEDMLLSLEAEQLKQEEQRLLADMNFI